MSRHTSSASLAVALALITAALLGVALPAPGLGASDPGAVTVKKKGAKKKSKGKITGKLSASGYTVIALSDTSTIASAVKVKGSKFKLPVPTSAGTKGKVVTLHLRAPNGTYGGPIVLTQSKSKKKGARKSKNRVIVGVNVKNGAVLGTIKVDASNGYAKTKKPPAKKFVYSKRVAQAKNGIPIGNGRNVGLVSSTAHGPTQDPDLDAVPNALDVDQNGNLILNNLDPATTAMPASRSARASQAGTAAFAGLGTQVIGETVNAYGSSDADIAAAFRGELWLAIMGGGVDAGSAELDCGALSYCSVGGTGRLIPTPPATPIFDTAQGFPRPCCDADGDGMGSLTKAGNQAFDFATQIFPGTTPDLIHPGDVLIVRATQDSAPVSAAASLGLIFTGFPALAKYDDGQGNANATPLTYPFDGHQYEHLQVPVRANSSGDVVVNMIFWRPQRLRLATEPGTEKWMDVGGMNHFAAASDVPFSAQPPAPGTPPGACPSSSYSNVGANLSPEPPGQLLGAYHLKDLSADRPTNRAAAFADQNTFSYTLNLTNCLAAYGLSFEVNRSRVFNFWALARASTGKPANVESVVSFNRGL